MQKIQFYLVPNRITVTTDMAGFNTEYRQVYQRTIKLHKGIDNTIELEVKNSDQRRQDVVGWDVVIKFFDAERLNVFTATGTAISSKPGLMSVTIGKDTLAPIDTQYLTAAAYLINDEDEEKILYSDSQFDVLARVEILDAYNEKSASGSIIEELTVFNYEYDSKEYISEIGRFGTRMNDDVGAVRTITVSKTGIHQGNIVAEATNDKSTAVGTQWTNIGVWNVEDDPTTEFSGDWRFVRFRIARERSTSGAGSGARFTVIKTNGVYSNLIITLRGQNYLIGDILTIPGGQLNGIDGINDITVTVTGLINGVSSQGNVDGFTWTGFGTAGSAVYDSIGTDPVTRPANPVDKIIIRN
jgi:hypothetical protein